MGEDGLKQKWASYLWWWGSNPAAPSQESEDKKQDATDTAQRLRRKISSTPDAIKKHTDVIPSLGSNIYSAGRAGLTRSRRDHKGESDERAQHVSAKVRRIWLHPPPPTNFSCVIRSPCPQSGIHTKTQKTGRETPSPPSDTTVLHMRDVCYSYGRQTSHNFAF